MARFLPFRPLSLFLLFFLLFASSAHAATNMTSSALSTNPDALWVLGRSALVKRAAGDGQLLFNVDMAAAHALAVNPQTGSLWVFTLNDELQHRKPDGAVIWSLPSVLPLLTSLVGARLLPDVKDDSVWLVGLNEAVHVDASGIIVARVSTLLPIKAVALDTQRQQLWLATPLTVERVDADGTKLSRLRGLFPALVRALAYDPVNDRLWAATPQKLVAYAAVDGSQQLEVPVRHISHMLPDGAGNLWVASTSRLTYLDDNGHTRFSLSHPVVGLLQGMAANPSDHSVWLAGLHQLVKVQSDGSASAPIDVPFTQLPLASLGLFVDDLPPTLSITQPVNGALIASLRPPLTLKWSDQGSGVDASSLAFTDNQQSQPFACQATDDGANCAPVSDLPQGVNNLVVTVKDKAGNTSAEAKAWWRVDTIAPEINFTGMLQPGFITNQIHALLTGTLNESGNVSVNGTQVASHAQQFSAPVTLTEGSNHINVSATDLAGNTRTLTVSGTLDTQPPAMPITTRVSVQMKGDEAVLTGKVGAVEAGTTVIITNNRTGQSVSVQADANGAFTASLAAQAGDTFSVQAGDVAGNHSDPVQVRAGDIPPDPATVAPPLPSTGTPPFVDRISFLYSGFYPIQKDVAPGTIVAKRAAVLAGKVMDTSGNPLPGVKVTVLNHPEFGYTHSQASGNFDMAVNGGGQLTLVFTQDGYLPVQRHVQAPWQGWAHAKDVAMTKLSSKVNAINLTNTIQPFQVAQGEVIEDSDGTRQATLLFPAGETATISLADGSTQVLSQIHLRVTEFTVGEHGPAAMPGPLPATTAYTYAVNFTIDEASEAVEKNGSSVTFSQPVPVYVNNFLDFPVGEAVPVGYYDPDKSAWVPYPNGRIVKLLSIVNGQAQLDVTGAGTPATPEQLAELGITSHELTQLTTLYQPGDSLWRFAVTHFSNWDCNWPFGPPTGASGPNVPPPPDFLGQKGDSDEHNNCKGCDIDAQEQSMGESIPVAGTPFSLHYNSARAAGAQSNRIDIPLTGDSVPTGANGIRLLTGVKLQVDIAGRHFVKIFSSDPNQSYTFVWDGKDALGRPVLGRALATITVSYQYPCIYFASSGSGNGFGQYGNQAIPIGTRSRCQGFEFPRKSQAMVSSPVDIDSTAAHWSLSVDHLLEKFSNYLLLGTGKFRLLSAPVIQNFASGVFSEPAGMAIGADGSMYVADWWSGHLNKITPDGVISRVQGVVALDVAIGPQGNLFTAGTDYRVRKISPDGVVTVFAGTGEHGFAGDGGLATQAALGNPRAIAVGADGSVYLNVVTSSGEGRGVIRKVSPDGIIETIVGGGDQRSISDDMLATDLHSTLYVNSLTVGPKGNLYFSSSADSRVVRLTQNGYLKIVAGMGQPGYGGDGGLAKSARLQSPRGLAFAPDGNLYIADTGNHRIRRVAPSGIITTAAGTGVFGDDGDGGAAIKASLGGPWGVVVSPEGSIYFSDYQYRRVRKIASLSIYQTSDGYIAVSSKDGTRRFVFDTNGNIIRTENATTGAIIYAFQRNVDGQLLLVTLPWASVTDSN